jgi:cysteine desulfurase
MEERIYLDNNASTPIDADALEAYIDVTKNHTGNPSSSHTEGKYLRSLLMKSRETIATFLDVKPKEVIFTSGATEAINMVISGIFDGGRKKGHIITSNLEHAAVLKSIQYLETCGVEVTYLSPGPTGAAQPEQVLEAIRPNTKLIALMAVNNETGVKTDIEGIAKIAEQHRIPFFVDAVALFGKELFTIPSGVTAMCTSGHKLHAPKGVGFVFIRRQLKIPPLLHGGSHEYGIRAGTENLSGIVAYGKVVEKLKDELPEATEYMRHLRDMLEEGLKKNIPDVLINGTGPRVCNTLNMVFPGVQGETLLANLDLQGIAVSHGSACASGALEPSRVLMNMGLPADLVRSSVRFSVSRMNTEDEIRRVIQIVTTTVQRLQPSVRV